MDNEDIKRIQEKIRSFQGDAYEIEKAVQKNLESAKAVFTDIKSQTQFHSIIEQLPSESKRLLEGCKDFATAVNNLTFEYPKLLRDFKEVLGLVIEDLREDHNLKVKIEGEDIFIDMDEHQLYAWEKGKEGFLPDKKVLKKHKRETRRAINDIVEIIELDLHIEHYLMYILKKENTTTMIRAAADEVQEMTDMNDPHLLRDMHILAIWWIALHKRLHKIRGATRLAAHVNRGFFKRLIPFIKGEEQLFITDKRLIAAKHGLAIVGGLAVNVFPYLDLFGGLFKIKKKYREAKFEIQEIEELQKLEDRLK